MRKGPLELFHPTPTQGPLARWLTLQGVAELWQRLVRTALWGSLLMTLSSAFGVAQARSPAPSAQASCPPLVTAGAGAATSERDRGLMWRISRDGRSSYLFATLHVGKPAWRRLGPRTVAALRNTDVLALEIDPQDPDLLKAMADLRPPPVLPDALQQRLDRAYQRACMASESMATLHPVLQATTLTVMEARWLGMDAAYAMEHLLTTQVRGLGRRVISLETAQQQVRALIPDSEEEAQALLEGSLQQLEDQSARRVLERLSAAWEAGDLGLLEDYARWCECAADEADLAFLRRLIDARNPQLADGIEAQHRQGRRVFAAIGALHMTGAASLPRLMQQRGFTVERVSFAR